MQVTSSGGGSLTCGLGWVPHFLTICSQDTLSGSGAKDTGMIWPAGVKSEVSGQPSTPGCPPAVMGPTQAKNSCISVL